MKVGFLLPHNGLSGGIFTIFEHARRLKIKGHDVLIIFQHSDLPIHIANYPGMEDVPAIFLADLDAEETFDVAIATWWETAYDIHRIKAAQYAYFVQGFEDRFYDAPDRLYCPYVRETYQESFKFFVISEALQRSLKLRFDREATVIRCAVNHELFAVPPAVPRSSDRLRVLVEGPGGPWYKRVDLAFSVLKHLPDTEVVYLSSDGVCDPGWHVDHYFERLPYGDVPGIYTSCDVLLKLSKEESFARPVLEMFAAGGTAVVTAFEGHDEYMRDGYNCLVVPIDDRMAALAALTRLINEPGLLDRLRKGARETALRFSWQHSNDLFEQELMATSTRTPRGELRRLTADVREELNGLRQLYRSRRELRHERDRLRLEVESLRRTEHDLRNSRTWRVGRLAGWPIRKLTRRP